MTKLDKIAHDIRENSWNNMTPKSACRKYGCTMDELKQVFKDNEDITVVITVNRPKATAPGPQPPSYDYLSDNIGQVAPNEIVQFWRETVTTAIQQTYVGFAKMHDITGKGFLWESGPVDTRGLMSSEFPDLWWIADSSVRGSKRKLKIESEWKL